MNDWRAHFWLLVVAIIMLLSASCADVQGNAVVVTTSKHYYGAYKAGALDMCRQIILEILDGHHVPRSKENTTGIRAECEARAGQLFTQRHLPESRVIPIPTPMLEKESGRL